MSNPRRQRSAASAGARRVRQPRPESKPRAQRGPVPRNPEVEASAKSTRMFATCMQGLGPLVRRELEDLPGVRVTDSGFDGRADIVMFEVDRGRRPDVMSLRTTDDVFVEVGRTLRSDGDNPKWIASRIWRPERVQRALSVWAEEHRPLRSAMTYRVIARVLQEQSFLRTDLRRELSRTIGSDRPRWDIDDPAQIEVWVSEYRRGRILAGLRLTDVRMRQHAGRTIERPGALRPAVAAAMVALAGSPTGELLDPCCGSGTILSEAMAVGWRAQGRDIDPDAVQIAQANAPGALIRVGDARHLDLPDESVESCASNLPFGRQYGVEGEMSAWLSAVLSELARVTRPAGTVVLLAPDIPRSAVSSALRQTSRFTLRLLGTSTTLWTFERT